MAGRFAYPAHEALQVIDGALATELGIHRFNTLNRSKAQPFGMGGPLGRQFAIVLGNTIVETGYHPAKQARLLFERCELPNIPGTAICAKPYHGERIKQQDSKLAAPNQVSCLVADEMSMASLLRRYAGRANPALGASALAWARVAKAADDAGFDLEVVEEGRWMVFRSAAFPAHLGIALHDTETYTVELGEGTIGLRLEDEFGVMPSAERGPWAVCFEGVAGYEKIYALIQRIAAVARALGQEGLRDFAKLKAHPPSTTEAVREVVQCVGQDLFRRMLIQFWAGKCAVTGLDIVELLRSSYIKPWAKCQTDEERLDVFNGLLLAPHLDALFDKGLVTFSDDGVMYRSPQLSEAQIETLGRNEGSFRPLALSEAHRQYLAWHRSHVFRPSAAGVV